MKRWLVLLMGLGLWGVISIVGFYSYLTKNGARWFSKMTGGSQRDWQRLVRVLRVYDLPYLVAASFIKTDLPEYELMIDPDDWQFLNTNLPREGLLAEEYRKFVPATVRIQRRDYPVKVRYRGDKPEHWLFTKKSWRIIFENETPPGDVYRLNLILPEDRGFYSEAISLFVARRMGLFNLRNEFISLKVNNQPMGAYFMVEQWSPEVLARNGLDADTNLYGEMSGEQFPDNLYSSSDLFQKYVSYSKLPASNKQDLDRLLDYLNNLSDDEFEEKIGQILDIDKFLVWQAHSQLLFNYNSGFTHNANLALNQDLGKLEFLPWDIAMQSPDEHSIYELNYNPLVERILLNPKWLCQRDKILLDYVSQPENLTDTLDYIDDLYRKTRWAFYKDQAKLFLDLGLDIRYRVLRSWLIKGHGKIRAITAASVTKCQE